MRAINEQHHFPVPPEGALLGVPGRGAKQRSIWIVRGALQKLPRPQPGILSLYAPDFFLDDPQPWLVPEDPADPESIQQLSTLGLPAADDGRPRTDIAWTLPNKPFFDECTRDLHALFEAGTLAKAVPVFFEHASFHPTNSDVRHWISVLRNAPETLVPYGRWSASGGILGASPEVLFEIHNGVLRTTALAGTLAAPSTDDANAEARFLADPKERREHCLVIEGISDALAPFGVVQVGATGILKLPGLWHLQTPIQVVLRETPEFEYLVKSLHPTPALGGSPRDASLQWLRQQDERQPFPTGRGAFGAPFGGQWPDGSAFCLVAIRNMMWDAKTLRIGSGCGMIRESLMDREWEELRQKRNSVKRLFGL